MKKLLTATALTSVLFAGAAVSDVKVGGNVEWTYNSVSYDKVASQPSGKRGFGQEENFNITYTGELNNGMAVKAYVGLEDGASNESYTSITSGGTTILWGMDAGPNSKGTFVPTVGDDLADTSGGVSSYKYENAQLDKAVHDANHISLEQKFEGGSVYVNYAPALDNSASDSAVVTTAGSGTEIGASFTVEGLKIVAGRETGKNLNDSDSTTSDLTDTVLAASYNFGNIAVGYQQRTLDDGTASDSDTKMTTLGVTYAANDNMTVGLQLTKSDKDGSTNDEEGQAITIGYSLGSMAVQASYTQIDNLGYAAGDDVDAIQIRTLTKF
jgi:predicted porin